jgi:hypothetical protein
VGISISGISAYQQPYFERSAVSGKDNSSAQTAGDGSQSSTEASRTNPGTTKDVSANEQKSSTTSGAQQLTPAEEEEVVKLRKRDTEVRVHEQAHIAAGGQYVRGGAHYEYATGPDGQRYAVGGEVSVDVSSVSGDPRATIVKMEVVKRAALAPAQPSSQDRSVAAAASRVEAQAQLELMAKAQEKLKAVTGRNSSTKGTLIDLTV